MNTRTWDFCQTLEVNIGLKKTDLMDEGGKPLPFSIEDAILRTLPHEQHNYTDEGATVAVPYRCKGYYDYGSHDEPPGGEDEYERANPVTVNGIAMDEEDSDTLFEAFIEKIGKHSQQFVKV